MRSHPEHCLPGADHRLEGLKIKQYSKWHLRRKRLVSEGPSREDARHAAMKFRATSCRDARHLHRTRPFNGWARHINSHRASEFPTLIRDGTSDQRGQSAGFLLIVFRKGCHLDRTGLRYAWGDESRAAEVPFSILCEAHSITLSDPRGHTMVKVAPHGKGVLKVGLSPIKRKRHVSRVEHLAFGADIVLTGSFPTGRSRFSDRCCP